jgi:hypothetical protein
MSRTLSYYKFILKRVSFDSKLFYKELNKAYKNISYEESLSLNKWLLSFMKRNKITKDVYLN